MALLCQVPFLDAVEGSQCWSSEVGGRGEKLPIVPTWQCCFDWLCFCALGTAAAERAGLDDSVPSQTEAECQAHIPEQVSAKPAFVPRLGCTPAPPGHLLPAGGILALGH